MIVKKNLKIGECIFGNAVKNACNYYMFHGKE